MRGFWDRIRHVICFEIIGILIIIPLGTWVFAHPAGDIGVVAIVGTTIASVWNYLYNWAFDHLMLRRTGSTMKSRGIRVIHAILFELGVLLLLLPFIAWYLDISIWEALLMDMGFAAFYMVYAYFFNLAYDRLFPLPQWQQK